MPLSRTDVRLLAARDSIDALTALINRAHAPLAAQGQHVLEAEQGSSITSRRVAQGQCFVAEQRGRIVGTLTVSRPLDLHDDPGGAPTYRDRDTAHLRQFAVEPELQRRGLGRRLVAACEQWARERGYKRVALDTAVQGPALRATFQRLGYVEIAQHPGGTLVTMEKALDQSPLRAHLRTLARYNLWATRELYRQVDTLPEADYRRDVGLFFKSVHGTLNHLLLGEHQIWYRRFAEGESPKLALDTEIERDRHALRDRLIDGALAWLPLIEVWPEARLLGKLEYLRVNGDPAVLPFAAALAHVFNHGTHHRGQVTAALTAMGRPCPELDLALMLIQEA